MVVTLEEEEMGVSVMVEEEEEGEAEELPGAEGYSQFPTMPRD